MMNFLKRKFISETRNELDHRQNSDCIICSVQLVLVPPDQAAVIHYKAQVLTCAVPQPLPPPLIFISFL